MRPDGRVMKNANGVFFLLLLLLLPPRLLNFVVVISLFVLPLLLLLLLFFVGWLVNEHKKKAIRDKKAKEGNGRERK